MDERIQQWLVCVGLLIAGATIWLIGVQFLGVFLVLAGIFSTPPVTSRIHGSSTAWSTSIISLLLGFSTGVFGFRGGILLFLTGISVNPIVYHWFVDRSGRSIPFSMRAVLVIIFMAAGLGQVHVATAGTYDPVAATERFHAENQTMAVLPTPGDLYGNWTDSSLETDGRTATRVLRHSSEGGNITLRATATAYENAAEASSTHFDLAPSPALNQNFTSIEDARTYGNHSVAFENEDSYGISFYHSNMYVVLGLSSDGSIPPDPQLIMNAASVIETKLSR